VNACIGHILRDKRDAKCVEMLTFLERMFRRDANACVVPVKIMSGRYMEGAMDEATLDCYITSRQSLL
jgi:hypothetical protein